MMIMPFRFLLNYREYLRVGALSNRLYRNENSGIASFMQYCYVDLSKSYREMIDGGAGQKIPPPT